jgi:hypothetical protein
VFIIVGMYIFFMAEGITCRPIANCKNSKQNGYLITDCRNYKGQTLNSIPGNLMPEVQVC